MQLVHSHKTSSYTYVLTEDEWYSGTEQQREAWVNEIKRKGAEAKCNNLNILVKPDALMSISPVGHTHSVFCQVAPQHNAEREFERELKYLIAKYSNLLSKSAIAVIANRVFE